MSVIWLKAPVGSFLNVNVVLASRNNSLPYGLYVSGDSVESWFKHASFVSSSTSCNKVNNFSREPSLMAAVRCENRIFALCLVTFSETSKHFCRLLIASISKSRIASPLSSENCAVQLITSSYLLPFLNKSESSASSATFIRDSVTSFWSSWVLSRSKAVVRSTSLP